MTALPSELRTLVRALRLRRVARSSSGATLHVGTGLGLGLLATSLGVGPVQARRSLEALLQAEHPDHVVVAGVAGAVAGHLGVGDVLVPAVVLDGPSGQRFVPTSGERGRPQGTLLSSAELFQGPESLARLVNQGVDAVDMETAAVALACRAAATPWSAVRAMSDHLAEGTVDERILALTRPDGSADVGAAVQLVAAHPSELRRLLRLARGTRSALRALGRALPEHLGALGPEAGGLSGSARR